MPRAIYHHFRQNLVELGTFQVEQPAKWLQYDPKLMKNGKEGKKNTNMWHGLLNLTNSTSGLLGNIWCRKPFKYPLKKQKWKKVAQIDENWMKIKRMANGRNWTNIVAKKWSWYSNKFVATVFCHFRATSDTGDPLKYIQEPKTALKSRKYICMINVG